VGLWYLIADQEGNEDEVSGEYAVMADSVREVAFGPLVRSTDSLSAIDALRAFGEWLETEHDIQDPRKASPAQLEQLYSEWRKLQPGEE
jgi:hypothetical protein